MTATLDPYEISARIERLEKPALRAVYVLSWSEDGEPHGRAFTSKACLKMAVRELQVNRWVAYTIHHLVVEA